MILMVTSRFSILLNKVYRYVHYNINKCFFLYQVEKIRLFSVENKLVYFTQQYVNFCLINLVPPTMMCV